MTPRQLKIREILFREWDPIPVSYNENLADEYDEFIPRIEEKIGSLATSQMIFDALLGFELEIGVQGDRETRSRVAQMLITLEH